LVNIFRSTELVAMPRSLHGSWRRTDNPAGSSESSRFRTALLGSWQETTYIAILS